MARALAGHADGPQRPSTPDALVAAVIDPDDGSLPVTGECDTAYANMSA